MPVEVGSDSITSQSTIFATNGLGRTMALCACRCSVFDRQDWTGRLIHKRKWVSTQFFNIFQAVQKSCKLLALWVLFLQDCRKPVLPNSWWTGHFPTGEAMLYGALGLGHHALSWQRLPVLCLHWWLPVPLATPWPPVIGSGDIC